MSVVSAFAQQSRNGINLRSLFLNWWYHFFLKMLYLKWFIVRPNVYWISRKIFTENTYAYLCHTIKSIPMQPILSSLFHANKYIYIFIYSICWCQISVIIPLAQSLWELLCRQEVPRGIQFYPCELFTPCLPRGDTEEMLCKMHRGSKPRKREAECQ